MMFLNFRHMFITLMFIAGAAALFLGYSGVAGMLLSAGPPAVESSVTGQAPGPAINTGSQTIPGGQNQAKAAAGAESFYVEYRLQRDKARSLQVEVLKDIIDSPSSPDDTIKAAQEQLLNISRHVARESRVENLLKARGYSEAVACVDQKGVTLVIESRPLTPAEESKLIEIISRETGYGEQSIIIVPKS